MMRVFNAQELNATWIYKDESFVYESVKVVGNEGSKSIRFELRETNRREPNFEIVFREVGDKIVFRADNYGDADDEFEIELFEAADSLVLFYEDDYGHVYFRLGL